jgi:2-oxoglutarate ferredoxin oxidoreductase subunit gamma
MKKEIRICGFGGQGIILAGVVLGEAATRVGYRAVQTQSYGPESRGGAARAEVVISSEPIDYPRVSRPDVVVALSQAGYDRFGQDVADDGIVLVDEALVEAEGVRSVPFTTTAEEVGRKIVANIVMVGYLGALIDVIPHDVIESTVLDNIPAGTEDLNRKAVRAGRDLWLNHEGGHDGS